MKSNGDSIKTAGNSFIVTKNTITAPINIPDFNIGIVILNIVLKRPFPSVLEDSSGFGLNNSMEDFMGPIPVGMYSIAQAMTKRVNDWYKGLPILDPINTSAIDIAILGKENPA